MKKFLRKFDELHVGKHPGDSDSEQSRLKHSSEVQTPDEGEDAEGDTLQTSAHHSEKLSRGAYAGSSSTSAPIEPGQIDVATSSGQALSSAVSQAHRSELPTQQDSERESIIRKSKFNSEDVTHDITVAPSVQHETITEHIRHVRQEHITREIHDHDIHHRILPIKDVELLPARHFLPLDDGRLIEVPASAVPGRAGQWALSHLPPSKSQSNDLPPLSPAVKSAGVSEEPSLDAHQQPKLKTLSNTEAGVTTWIHPPMVETGAEKTGQTQPLLLE